jgi:hypothetical protein
MKLLLDFYGIDEKPDNFFNELFELDDNYQPSKTVERWFQMKQDEMFLL